MPNMNQVYDALNNLASPDFYLGLRVEGAPETPPPGARLRGKIGRWLATLGRQVIQQCYLDERYGDVPTHEWAHDGWRIIFDPRPILPCLSPTTPCRSYIMRWSETVPACLSNAFSGEPVCV
jgi:hypothetical protein